MENPPADLCRWEFQCCSELLEENHLELPTCLREKDTFWISPGLPHAMYFMYSYGGVLNGGSRKPQPKWSNDLDDLGYLHCRNPPFTYHIYIICIWALRRYGTSCHCCLSVILGHPSEPESRNQLWKHGRWMRDSRVMTYWCWVGNGGMIYNNYRYLVIFSSHCPIPY